MAEWFKAAVLKTVSRKRDVGSNPTPSANKIATQFYETVYNHLKKILKSGIDFQNFLGEMAELAEGARLLSE
jgi:hypothetical protein